MISLVLIVAAVGYFTSGENSSPSENSSEAGLSENQISINGKVLDIIWARTSEEQEAGLGGKESLPENSGMLFVFDVPEEVGIWMENMLFPLDVVWADETGKIISMQENLDPETYPESFYPQSPAKYVLETNAGFLASNNIKIGDVIKIGE